MLIDQAPELDRTFAALSDPTRRRILRNLASGGEAAAGSLAQRFPISPPAISRHLRVLEAAGLITRRVDGKHRRLKLDPQPLHSAVQWLEFYRRFWTESLQQLADHFAAPPPPPPPADKRESKSNLNVKPSTRSKHGRRDERA